MILVRRDMDLSRCYTLRLSQHGHNPPLPTPTGVKKKGVCELCYKAKKNVLIVTLVAVFLNHTTPNVLKNPVWPRLLSFELNSCLRILIWTRTRLTTFLLKSVWTQICLWQNFKKTAQTLKSVNKTFLEIPQHRNHVQIFTNGSKFDEKVAAAAVSSLAPNSPSLCPLREHSYIYTAELQAVLFAFRQANT